MKHLTRSDLLPLPVYLRLRDEYRAAIIRLKRNRRILVGPRLMFVFENRETMKFQVMEMLRAEEIVDPVKVQEELDVYNDLLPPPGGLSATMFIQFSDTDSLRREMASLARVESRIWLRIGDSDVHAEYEKGRSRADRTSSVHYLKFRLTPAQRALFLGGKGRVTLEARLPKHRHATPLPPAAHRELAKDLEAAPSRIRPAPASRSSRSAARKPRRPLAASRSKSF